MSLLERSLAAGLILAVIAAGGCGYTTRSMVTTKYKTIYIEPFVNKVDITQETDTSTRYKIYRPSVETELTKSVISKYLFDGNLKPVKKETADLVLKGELIEFRKDPLRYSTNDEVDEYRINIVVNITLQEPKTEGEVPAAEGDAAEEKIIWKESGFTGDSTYYPATTSLQNVVTKSEDVAVTDAINDLARRIVERTVEEW